MARKTTNAEGRAADAEAQASTAAEKPEQGPAPTEAAVAASAADGSAQGPEAAVVPAKTGETDGGSPAPGADEAAAAAANGRLKPVLSIAERLGEVMAGAAILPEPSGREVVVVGPKRGRWRAGRRFGPEETRIPLEELTEDDKAALIADPVLIVSVAEVSRRP
ncbi:MAG: hypothetical protein CML43_22010 [Rhodobacteraceae bacterium]|nr:hypothetical protein [Paracoccaceae bacterium]